MDDTHIVQIIATRLTPPPSFRDQFSNWSWESVLIGTVYSFSAAYGDADCHVARPSLLAMTGQFSRAPISLPLSAAPLRGSPQCAHWGKGSPERDTVREGKDRTHPDHPFPHWQFLSLGDPSVSLMLDSSPKRGAKGVGESLRADFALYLLQIGATAYPSSVIQRRAKPDVGIRSPLRRT